MNINSSEFLNQLKEADMVLIGIGEEFDDIKALKQRTGYSECKQKLIDAEKEWMIPALNMIYEREESDIYNVLSKFAEIIADKNYFVVSVSTNEMIREVSWRENRLVMPCGGSRMKQCIHNCEQGLIEVTESDWSTMKTYRDSLLEDVQPEAVGVDLGVCPECGNPLVLNSIYTEKYDENGYLNQWKLYTKWLQGSLNRKLLVLELGVGMQCPSVIRWPFEKVAFFNQKASFWRVNETLYQLSEELKGKGTSISLNAIDWLRFLC